MRTMPSRRMAGSLPASIMRRILAGEQSHRSARDFTRQQVASAISPSFRPLWHRQKPLHHQHPLVAARNGASNERNRA